MVDLFFFRIRRHPRSTRTDSIVPYTTHFRSDPSCGMDVDPATAAYRVEHDGMTYVFCGARCAETFQRDPQAVLARLAKPDAGGTCCSAGRGAGTGSQPDRKSTRLNSSH